MKRKCGLYSLWMIQTEKDVFNQANQESVKQLKNLLSFQAERVVARSDNKWGDYQLDITNATKVDIYENNIKKIISLFLKTLKPPFLMSTICFFILTAEILVVTEILK